MAKKTSIPTTKSEQFKAALLKLRDDARRAMGAMGQADTPEAILAASSLTNLVGSPTEKALEKAYYMALIDEIAAEKVTLQDELGQVSSAYQAAQVEHDRRLDAWIRADESYDGFTVDQVVESYRALVVARRAVEPLREHVRMLKAPRDECDGRIEKDRAELRQIEPTKPLSMASAFEPAAEMGGRAVVEPMR